MKRIHLFEFEDLQWFPAWLRRCLTRLIIVMHKLLNSEQELAQLLAGILKSSDEKQIIDLCSGSGGPMVEVSHLLKEKYEMEIKLILSDLYPDMASAQEINALQNHILYWSKPLDAQKADSQLHGLRTMVGSFHHMAPREARKILEAVVKSKQPICIFEISDNSYPKWLWWTAIPINFLTCLFITPLVRPLGWQQLVFTYLIPVIPLCFAWDGAVSNARTYTLNDLDQLLEGLQTNDYQWEKGVLKGKARKLYLIGKPQKAE